MYESICGVRGVQWRVRGFMPGRILPRGGSAIHRRDLRPPRLLLGPEASEVPAQPRFVNAEYIPLF